MIHFGFVVCSRPTALQDRNRDSDEEDVHDRDYDVAALADNFSQAFRYTIYENDDAEVLPIPPTQSAAPPQPHLSVTHKYKKEKSSTQAS